MSDPILQSIYNTPEPVKQKTLPEYYMAKAQQYTEEGRHYWMVDGLTGEKRFFSKFEEETRKIASAFHKLGLRKGDVVIYMIKDLCKLHITLNGVWRANGIMRASYPDDDLNTILARVKESNVKFIVCEEEAIELCKHVSAQTGWVVNVITVNRNTFGLASIQEFMEDDIASSCPDLLIDEDDAALILCTSGTTGLPKGAVHTHKGFLYQTRMMELIPWTHPKPNLVATKATHVSGAAVGLVMLGSGKRAVVVSNLTQEKIFHAASKYKPGFAFAFPTFLMAMAGPEAKGYDFSSIEILFSGGVLITPTIRKTLMKLPNVKDIIVAYGLTETMMCTTSAVLKGDQENETPSMRDLPDFSVGKLFPGTSLQIRDVSTLEIVGPFQQGEICVKTPGLFHSYLNNPVATENAYVDGYFRTGDIGYYEGNTGYVYVVDRQKEIFKYYNDHISPSELENIIGKHLKVNEVCVIGFPDAGGHVPRAFVTVHSNSENRDVLAKEICTFANAQLAPYKQLRGGLFIVDELPKGKSGKITRQLVEKLLVPS